MKKDKEWSGKRKHMRQDRTANNPFIINILKKSIIEYDKILQYITSNELNKESILIMIEKFLLKTRMIIDQNSHNEMAVLGNKVQVFEKEIAKKWEIPFRLMSILIEMSTQIGDEMQEKFSRTPSNKNKFQQIVLVKINTRSIRISNEILYLSKGGFADGAMARWRSLHELAVISCFLQGQKDEVSERYLEYGNVEELRYAKKYQQYEKKLGLKTIPTENLDELERERNRLIEKHKDGLKYKNGLGWLPDDIPVHNFLELEEFVGLGDLRIFYNISSNAIHGSAKGLHGLDIPEYMQNHVLSARPSNYGLALPLHIAAYSLSRVTRSLLAIENDLESTFYQGILAGYYNDITAEATKIQTE